MSTVAGNKKLSLHLFYIKNRFISICDLERFLIENNISFAHKELFNLFKLYDSNCDGKITYSDFIRKILPKEDMELRELCSLR